jgi:adenosylhomocysteine nucleosidase
VKTLLFIASERRELAGLLRHAGGEEALPLPVDYARRAGIGGRRCLLVANGPGPRLAGAAARAVLASERVDAVISTGFCGGLDPALSTGEVVSAGRIVDYDGGAEYPACAVDGMTCVAMACGDRVAGTAEEKQRLRRRTGAAAVDMESAAVAREALRAGAEFYCVRVVTDTAAESFANDFNASRDASGRFSKRAVVLRAMARPWSRGRELIRLARVGRQAASVLGDRLAACQF